LSGDKRLGHLFPAAFMLAVAACSAAIAARVSKPASFLQVSAQVDATPAATRNCRLPISVLTILITSSFFYCYPSYAQTGLSCLICFRKSIKLNLSIKKPYFNKNGSGLLRAHFIQYMGKGQTHFYINSSC
jgi:hypothetical protein